MEQNEQMWKDTMKNFFLNHRWAIVWALIGLIICILILTINFWRTFLICMVVGICILIGSLMDKGGWEMVRVFLDRVLPRK